LDENPQRKSLTRHRNANANRLGIASSLRPSSISSIHNKPIAFNNHQQVRHISWLPEAFQSFSIWGGSGYLIKVFHDSLHLEYWACFAAMNVIVRVALFPLVLYGAQTSSRFAKVIPEVQFILTLLNNDLKKLREQKAAWQTRAALMITNLRTMGGIYKLHKINPFSVFLSPLLQLPIFIYVSTDLRKILNGLDPLLAQKLVDSSVAWIPDLTEPDPWFGLPVLAGLVMYANIEVAVGKRSLSGATAAKSDTAVLMKDMFQSASVFMPCFTAQLPAGVQIYLVTSFMWTLGQSAALRTESFRQLVGLPSLLAPPPEASYAKEFIQLKQLEQKARELRGNGPLLGVGVLAPGYQASFAGTFRESTIQGSDISPTVRETILPETVQPKVPEIHPMIPFIHGISAPPIQLMEQKREEERKKELSTTSSTQQVADREYMPQFDDDVMEKANRGEFPSKIQFVERNVKIAAPSTVSLKRFKKSSKTKKKPRS
jgi:membrane protein insertase Oxa1/YidC/SpoIIIJ